MVTHLPDIPFFNLEGLACWWTRWSLGWPQCSHMLPVGEHWRYQKLRTRLDGSCFWEEPPQRWASRQRNNLPSTRKPLHSVYFKVWVCYSVWWIIHLETLLNLEKSFYSTEKYWSLIQMLMDFQCVCNNGGFLVFFVWINVKFVVLAADHGGQEAGAGCHLLSHLFNVAFKYW